MAPRGEHSAKPECFFEMIEQYFPNLPKIELNRRGPARPGWDAWGNEIATAPAAPAPDNEVPGHTALVELAREAGRDDLAGLLDVGEISRLDVLKALTAPAAPPPPPPSAPAAAADGDGVTRCDGVHEPPGDDPWEIPPDCHRVPTKEVRP